MTAWFTLFDLLHDWNKHLISDILNIFQIYQMYGLRSLSNRNQTQQHS